MSQLTNLTVTFLPGGEEVVLAPGLTIAEAAHQAGLNLSVPCGGKGICGNCRVSIQEGEAPEPTAAEARSLSPAELADGMRLACQCLLESSAVVQLFHLPQVVGKKDLRQLHLRAVPLDANVKRLSARVDPPSLEDQRSDFRRLAEALGGTCSDLTALPDALRALPAALREKYGLKAGSTVQVVDYGGVLALVPALENPITDGAGLAKGEDSLTQAIVDQHRQDRERE